MGLTFNLRSEFIIEINQKNFFELFIEESN